MLRQDPQRAKVEILKHLDGDLLIVPRPSSPGERRAEISGRAKSDSLLRSQEPVCLQVVEGPAILKSNNLTFAIDLVCWRASAFDRQCADAISYRSVPSCPPSDPYADVAGRPASWSVNTGSPAWTVADQLMVMASLTL